MMKSIALFCSLILFSGMAFAEEKEMSETPSLPDASLLNKEELKKLPRLGMTLQQLRILWGNQTATDEDAPLWQNIGGIKLQATFSPTFLTDTGFFIDPNKSRCASISFSSATTVPLSPEEAIKIAEALLPGFSFKYVIPEKPDKEPELDPYAKPGPDPQQPFFSPIGTKKDYSLKAEVTHGSFCIDFEKLPRILNIETDKL